MRVLHQNTAMFGLAANRNYFGDESDGDIRITSSGAEQSFNGGVTWTAIPGWTLVGSTVSIPSTQDGDMIVVQAISFTVDAGMTLTLANRCRGLLILATGNVSISGTISVSNRGCHANPGDTSVTSDTPVPPGDGNPVPLSGITFRWFAAGETSSDTSTTYFDGTGTLAKSVMSNQPVVSSGRVFRVPRFGATGGVGSTQTGANGSPAASGCGGGGAGAGDASTVGGNGTSGTCFSGGVGGGGNAGCASPSHAALYGGRGGVGRDNDAITGGGAGNPGGAGGSTCTGGDLPAYAGTSGTGGFLAIAAGGNMTLASGSGLLARGGNGGNGSGGVGGGASGGGVITMFYAGTLTNSSTNISTVGGTGGTGVWNGGNGGSGAVNGPFKIDPA